MKHLLYILSAAVLFGTTACRKYVEISPENVRELKYTKDYQALLYNSALIEKGYYYALYAGDDIWAADGSAWQTYLNTNAANSYCWLSKIWSETQEDDDWANSYKNIYLSNTVITEVMTSTGGTDAEKKKAYAEALVHRAFAYYTLVNIYARQYDAATAADDPGVPLLLTNTLFASLKRAPVAEVYNQVEKDLLEALPLLPALPDYVTNPSQAAAFSMLARVYLNKRAFTDAERYADSTLALKNGLDDLNAYISATYPTKLNDPENIFSKITSIGSVNLPLSNETINLFDTTNDLRYKLFTQPGVSIPVSNFTNRGYNKHRLVNQGIYVGPCVPELMLIKAECEARAGNTAAAMNVLNALRKKRFIPSGYTDLMAATPQEALLQVINERRRELMGRGFRWFDQRRLQKDTGAGFVQTVVRVFKGTTYTLEPGNNRYVFPIGEKYILLNPEIEQNPQ